MHSINFNLAIRYHTCHNFAFCCISDSRHNHLFVLLMLVWESLFMVVFVVNLLVSTHCYINLIHEIYTVMSACIENMLYNANKMAIFILCVPLLKCSEPWNCLLWRFEQSYTIQVWLYKFPLSREGWFTCHTSGLSVLTEHVSPYEDGGGLGWGAGLLPTTSP